MNFSIKLQIPAFAAQWAKAAPQRVQGCVCRDGHSGKSSEHLGTTGAWEGGTGRPVDDWEGGASFSYIPFSTVLNFPPFGFDHAHDLLSLPQEKGQGPFLKGRAGCSAKAQSSPNRRKEGDLEGQALRPCPSEALGPLAKPPGPSETHSFTCKLL